MAGNRIKFKGRVSLAGGLVTTGSDGIFTYDDENLALVKILKSLSKDAYGRLNDINGVCINDENKPAPVETEGIEVNSPDDSWKKDDIKHWMETMKIEFNSGDTKADLLQKIELAK